MAESWTAESLGLGCDKIIGRQNHSSGTGGFTTEYTEITEADVGWEGAREGGALRAVLARYSRGLFADEAPEDCGAGGVVAGRAVRPRRNGAADAASFRPGRTAFAMRPDECRESGAGLAGRFALRQRLSRPSWRRSGSGDGCMSEACRTGERYRDEARHIDAVGRKWQCGAKLRQGRVPRSGAKGTGGGRRQALHDA